jgi:hypothetical protein
MNTKKIKWKVIVIMCPQIIIWDIDLGNTNINLILQIV